jgi:hypothetical protein
MWPSGTPCAERSDLLPVPPREGFLLCSALDGDGIGDPLEFLMPHQTNGPASRRIAAKRARVVLPDAPVEGGAR